MRNSRPGEPAFHYGWVIVFAGMLSIVACLGFGRFALGMLLPSMAATLHLSYSQMGFISTANFLGYLVSVLVSGHVAVKAGPRLVIFFALLLVTEYDLYSLYLIQLLARFIPPIIPQILLIVVFHDLYLLISVFAFALVLAVLYDFHLYLNS